MILDDYFFMREALKQAEIAMDLGEVPVGAVVVANEQIIGKGYNQTAQLKDVTAHAELQALTAASIYLDSKYLTESTLYVTLEPCIMCTGALYWAQLGRLVYGANDDKRGGVALKKLQHPKTLIKAGVMASECSLLLKKFFEGKR